MAVEIRSRQELLLDLAAAVVTGEPMRLLVILRLGGFPEVIGRFGERATEALVRHVVDRLPAAAGPSSFYSRPRKDELCGLISGRLLGVEGALSVAAAEIAEILDSSGISLGFGTAVLPREASSPVQALTPADGRIVGIEDGEPLPRGSASGVLASGMLQLV